MASKQVMLTAVALLLGACAPKGAEPLVSPYGRRSVWAVAPLHNESGSLQVDSFALADKLIEQLDAARDIDVVPLNRVLAVMESMQIKRIVTATEAQRVMAALGVDALVIGTVTAYDPYDPPKIGLAIELYLGSPMLWRPQSLDELRRMNAAGTDPLGQASGQPGPGNFPGSESLRSRPAAALSMVFSASDPHTVKMLQQYAGNRGRDAEGEDAWHRYRVSMDLYSEFVSYVVSWRLLRSEAQRLEALAASEKARSTDASARPVAP